MPTLSRHMPLFRRYVNPADEAQVVVRCIRPESPSAGTHLLLLTRQQLVVTMETRLLRRPRLHLEASVADLQTVTWETDPASESVDLAVSTLTGRQRYWIRSLPVRQLWRLDAALVKVFRASADVARRGVGLSPRAANAVR